MNQQPVAPEVNDGDFGVPIFLQLDAVKGANSIVSGRKVFEGRVPDHQPVVAREETGNLLCLTHADGDRGRMYFFDNELEIDPEYPPHPKLFPSVAPSFAEFAKPWSQSRRSRRRRGAGKR